MRQRCMRRATADARDKFSIGPCAGSSRWPATDAYGVALPVEHARQLEGADGTGSPQHLREGQESGKRRLRRERPEDQRNAAERLQRCAGMHPRTTSGGRGERYRRRHWLSRVLPARRPEPRTDHAPTGSANSVTRSRILRAVPSTVAVMSEPPPAGRRPGTSPT